MFSGRTGIEETDAHKPFQKFQCAIADPIGSAAGDHHFTGRWKRKAETFQIHFAFFDVEDDLRGTGGGIHTDPRAFHDIGLKKSRSFHTSLIFVGHDFRSGFSIGHNGEIFYSGIPGKSQGKQNKHCKKLSE